MYMIRESFLHQGVRIYWYLALLPKIYIYGKSYLTMVEIETATISSKGQIVIPVSMRSGIKEGDRFLIIKNKSNFLLKKADDLDEKFKEDLEFARRTEEAYKRHEAGDFIQMSSEDFLKELKKW
jgi:AbrB family looped-hinge helix DNA binding protein